MSPSAPDRATPAPRIAGLIGWGLALGLLFVLWQRPALLMDLVRPAEHVSDCDLAAEPCAVVLPDDRRMVLTASPAGMPVGQALTWQVESDDDDLTPVALEITGQSMNMGLTRVALAPSSTGWTGTAALPVCTSRSMDWRIDVRYRDAGGTEGLATFMTTTRREAGSPTRTSHNDSDSDSDSDSDTAPAAPVTRSDFTVQTADGDLSLSDLRGEAVVLYFGYTACPDICPTTLASVGEAFALLDEEEQARTAGLFVSLDPERDDVERLSRYAPYFHPAIRGSTSDPATVAGIAADWGVAFRKVPMPDSALGYAVDHSTDAYLVGPDGRFLRTLPHGMPPAELAAAVRGALHDSIPRDSIPHDSIPHDSTAAPLTDGTPTAAR